MTLYFKRKESSINVLIALDKRVVAIHEMKTRSKYGITLKEREGSTRGFFLIDRQFSEGLLCTERAFNICGRLLILPK